MKRAISTLVMLGLLSSSAQPAEYARFAVERWFHEADRMANEGVTYAMCGWGDIDLRTPFLESAYAQGVDPQVVLGELAKRFDDAVRERQRIEAVLALNPANAPETRRTGLFATGGCPGTLKAEIEKKR